MSPSRKIDAVKCSGHTRRMCDIIKFPTYVTVLLYSFTWFFRGESSQSVWPHQRREGTRREDDRILFLIHYLLPIGNTAEKSTPRYRAPKNLCACAVRQVRIAVRSLGRDFVVAAFAVVEPAFSYEKAYCRNYYYFFSLFLARANRNNSGKVYIGVGKARSKVLFTQLFLGVAF